MYQHTRLYEFSPSLKLLLTGFVVAICAAGVLALAGIYHACKDLDGNPAISFADIERFIGGSTTSVLENAADHPRDYGLGDAREEDLILLSNWCENGAPRRAFPEIQRILANSDFAHVKRTVDDEISPRLEQNLADEYRRFRALATPTAPLSNQQLGVGIAIYLSLVSLGFLGLGMLFVRTSMFEKRKLFFIASAFVLILACPIFLWQARQHPAYTYPMLLSLLLMCVCFGVFAVVALYDLWLRRAAT